VDSDGFRSRVYRKILGVMAGGRNDMGAVMGELIADPGTSEAKRMPGFVQKVIKDLHSEPEEIRRARLESEGFDEKRFLAAELPGICRKEFGAEVAIHSESDGDIHDPKGKAGHARPFKPAILIE